MPVVFFAFLVGFICSLLNLDLSNSVYFIFLVCCSTYSIEYGATESSSRLRRLQYASTAVRKEPVESLSYVEMIELYPSSEYYDYELHVVEWG